MRVRAFAKINLSLRVLGTRPDGYHELRTVFQSIALHDTLTVRRVRGPLQLVCNDDAIACDRTNLVWRAADALWVSMRRRGSARDVAIDLRKRIPIQAGLGGGSSDAAATLRALQKLWRVDPQCVREAAVRLGADVPYFLEGGTVLGLERGDVLFPLIDRPRQWVVLVIPPFDVSTPEAYHWLDVARSLQPSGRRSPKGFAPHNDLEPVVAKRHPAIARIVRDLAKAGAACAAMSGSGSAVFGLFGSRAAAEKASKSMKFRAILTRTLSRAEYRRLAAN